MSIPFYGREFTFAQPDGSRIQVRGWGDQHQAVFETLDGYTLVLDPSTGFYHYATLSDDGEELQSTGVLAGKSKPTELGIHKRLRISPVSARAKAEDGYNVLTRRRRCDFRRERAKTLLRAAMSTPGRVKAPPPHETKGDYVGLCLVIQFPDVLGTLSERQVADFCNSKDYRGFGNNGSVYDYFYDTSGGRLRYTNAVTSYYTAKNPRAYYTDPCVSYATRARELIEEALADLKVRGFNFNQLTADDEDYVFAVNALYAGPCVNNWAQGLWPHSSRLAVPYVLSPGRRACDYQITDMGSELMLATFCHENGHMICDFPDLYDYGGESRGAGNYCLMCTGGVASPKNPVQVCAYLKYRAGWAKRVAQITKGTRVTIVTGENDFCLYTRNPAEYFIIESRYNSGRDAALPASGLAIWHVDELGSNSNEQMTSTTHYECSLVQADDRSDLERGANTGDAGDLYHAGGNTHFADSTAPGSKWWDGSPSGLDIFDVSVSGQTMTFSTGL